MAVEFARYTPEEQVAADVIADRAVRLFREYKIRRTKQDVMMDLSAVHARVPLRLAELAEADEFNFAHDVFGIYRHLDRQTGKLENFFLPRYARPLSERVDALDLCNACDAEPATEPGGYCASCAAGGE